MSWANTAATSNASTNCCLPFMHRCSGNAPNWRANAHVWDQLRNGLGDPARRFEKSSLAWRAGRGNLLDVVKQISLLYSSHCLQCRLTRILRVDQIADHRGEVGATDSVLLLSQLRALAVEDGLL